ATFAAADALTTPSRPRVTSREHLTINLEWDTLPTPGETAYLLERAEQDTPLTALTTLPAQPATTQTDTDTRVTAGQNYAYRVGHPPNPRRDRLPPRTRRTRRPIHRAHHPPRPAGRHAGVRRHARHRRPELRLPCARPDPGRRQRPQPRQRRRHRPRAPHRPTRPHRHPQPAERHDRTRVGGPLRRGRRSGHRVPHPTQRRRRRLDHPHGHRRPHHQPG